MCPFLLVDEVEDYEEEGVDAEDEEEEDHHLHLLFEKVLAVQQLDFSVLKGGIAAFIIVKH
jgi:hypothetical protein